MIVVVSVITILVLLSIYVVVITYNIQFSPIGIFNWNPPPKENGIPMILPYPDAVVVNLPGTDFVVTLTMEYNGTLAENTLIQIVNASCVGFTDEALKISVGFSESIATKDKSAVSSGAGIIGWSGTWCVSFSQEAQHNNVTVDIHLLPPKEMNEIYFPVAGDYSPIILVTKDGNTTQYTYNQIKVHVLPASEIEAENTSRLNLGLTWALLGFSYVGGIIGVYELMGKQENKAQSTRGTAKEGATPHEVDSSRQIIRIRNE